MNYYKAVPSLIKEGSRTPMEVGSQASSINLILDQRGSTVSEISARTGLPVSRIKTHLNKMVSNGVVQLNNQRDEDDAASLRERISTMSEKANQLTLERDQLRKSLIEFKKELETIKNSPTGFKEVVLRKGEKTKTLKGEVFHSVFADVVQLAHQRKNILVYGPTGCGKTVMARQVADALGLEFSAINCTSGMSESKLIGSLYPIGDEGKYFDTEFLKRFEFGGVFLFDEFDAMDPNVALVINTALANGYISIPNRPDPIVKMHPDFVCIATANTLGTGASRTYSARNKLDMATLDRFNIGKVEMGYDSTIDEAVCPDDQLRKVLLTVRQAINEFDLERAMSTRFLKDAHDMLEAGWNGPQIMASFLRGWREDEQKKVQNFVKEKLR